MRRHRARAHLLLLAAGAGAAGFLALGAGWSPPARPPGADPGPVALDGLSEASRGAALPPHLADAAAALPAELGVDAASGRVLLTEQGVTLGAVPTADGNLCLLVDGAAAAPVTGCGARVDAGRPAIGLAIRSGERLVVAGIALDDAVEVAALAPGGELCRARPVHNAFLCWAVADGGVVPTAWYARLRNGRDLTYSDATIAAVALPPAPVPTFTPSPHGTGKPPRGVPVAQMGNPDRTKAARRAALRRVLRAGRPVEPDARVRSALERANRTDRGPQPTVDLRAVRQLDDETFAAPRSDGGVCIAVQDDVSACLRFFEPGGLITLGLAGRPLGDGMGMAMHGLARAGDRLVRVYFDDGTWSTSAVRNHAFHVRRAGVIGVPVAIDVTDDAGTTRRFGRGTPSEDLQRRQPGLTPRPAVWVADDPRRVALQELARAGHPVAAPPWARAELAHANRVVRGRRPAIDLGRVRQLDERTVVVARSDGDVCFAIRDVTARCVKGFNAPGYLLLTGMRRDDDGVPHGLVHGLARAGVTAIAIDFLHRGRLRVPVRNRAFHLRTAFSPGAIRSVTVYRRGAAPQTVPYRY